MYSKEHLERLHSQVVTIQEQLQRDVDEYLKDKDNSLEDRWEVWTKYSTTNSGNWIHKFPKKFKELDNYVNNGERNDRGSTITYDQVIESYKYLLIKQLLDDEPTYSEKEWKIVEDSTQLSEIKEYLMKQNLRSYKFDW